MAIQTIIKNTVSLEEPITRHALRDILGGQDDQAHRFDVTVKSGGAVVDLTGANVTGYFIRADGATVILTGGDENGSAYVVLNDSCYAVPGRFSFAMKVQVGDVRHTVLWYEGSVGQTSTDSLVDPDNVVPSLEELLAQISAAEQAADRANAAADAAAEFANLEVVANTLPNGADATASYENGVLTIGLPKGPKGDTGSASPITVNGIEAIGSNITLTAPDVGALPEEGTAADAEKLGGKSPEYYVCTQKLLHNSDFTHWVAQAGIGGNHGTQAYGGDRWILDNGTITGEGNSNGEGYKNITLNGTIRQIVANPPETATAFIGMVSGTANISYSDGEVTITSAGGVIEWAMLVPGEWAEAPLYVPNGYISDLLECQSCFRAFENCYAVPYYDAKDLRYYAIALPVNMRINPTLELGTCTEYYGGWATVNSTVSSGNNRRDWIQFVANGEKEETNSLFLLFTAKVIADF